MKRRKLYIIIPAITGISLALFLLIKKIDEGGFEKELVPAFIGAQSTWKDICGPYLLTRWKQDGVYAAFTPDQELLGCWSVAFAQILAFHKLSPSGVVDYVTSGNTRIRVQLNDSVNWGKIITAADRDSLPENSVETAKYCFNVASVLRKDFGTGDYQDISLVPQEVSDHYKCTVMKVNTDIVRRIRSEIIARRPVIAYFNDILAIRIVRNGHAAVIDGIAEDDNALYVHLNCGWGGKSDGWYEYTSLTAQRKLQYIFTLIPL